MNERKCPKCSEIMNYKTIASFDVANKRNSQCKKCSYKERSNKYKGENNPFCEKKHTAETIEKLKNRNTDYLKTEEFRQTMSSVTKGDKNPMYGRKVFDIWLEKYGEEEANRKMDICKAKHSKNNSGKDNPMYGKSCPGGSGYGWKGWYKGWFFRSLRELSYVIKVLELNNSKWKSAENSVFRVEYQDFLGNDRTYCADFIVDDKYLVEIKPERLHKTRLIQLKSQAAIEFCNKNGLIYQLLDVELLSTEEIRELYNSEQIKFTERYEKLYKEKYLT